MEEPTNHEGTGLALLVGDGDVLSGTAAGNVVNDGAWNAVVAHAGDGLVFGDQGPIRDGTDDQILIQRSRRSGSDS